MLFYDGKRFKTVDKNASYEIVGIIDNKLIYYKNKYVYGTEKTFYIYDGKHKEKAFDLDISYYVDVNGYPYDDGILINVTYESNETLYKYDGKKLTKIKLPSNVFRITDLKIIDNKIYMNYSDGEESFDTYGFIIDLK